MKKRVFTAALLTAMVLQSIPAFAAEYEATAYDVSIADELKVPFADSKEGYFEGGLVTGFGSAVTFKGYNEAGEMQFYAVTDRGPNADAPKYEKDGTQTEAKIFPCPEFTPSIGIVTIKDNGAVVDEAITLKDAEGNEISGLPLEPGQVGATGERALDMQLNDIGYDNEGLDTEGIAVDADGNFWLCDEYGPFIVKTDANGKILEKYAPGEGLPEILQYRIPNRGFEGLTITPNGTVMASVQSVLDVNGETDDTACFTRIVALDPETGDTKMYAYPVDLSQYSAPSNCKIGDIYAVDDDTLLVIEQGKLADKTMSNKIYQVDLSKATDISDMTVDGKALEYASAEELQDDVVFAEKELLLDLRDYGWTAEKAEGLCMVDENTIAVINDNDFGIVTVTEDAANEDADITDYVYDVATGTFTKDGTAADVKVSIGENTEPAQIWTFQKTEEPAAETSYISIRNGVLQAQEGGKTYGVDFDSEKQQVVLTTGGTYTATGKEDTQKTLTEVGEASAWKIVLDGTALDIPVYHINGYNYVDQQALEAALA